MWNMTGYVTSSPDAKVALLRWQNSKGKHARVCLITKRSVKKTDLCIIVKVGSDVKYENI